MWIKSWLYVLGLDIINFQKVMLPEIVFVITTWINYKCIYTSESYLSKLGWNTQAFTYYGCQLFYILDISFEII